MAYESGGWIWYSKSTNDGATWSPEDGIVPVDPSFGLRAPSLTVQQNPHLVVIVYDAYGLDGSYHYVQCQTRDPLTGNVVSDETISSGSGNSPTIPVVGEAKFHDVTHYVLAVWSDGLTRKKKISARNSSTGAWSTPLETSSNPVDEIAIAPIEGDYQRWQFCWMENDNLLYNYATASATPTITAPDELVANGSYVEYEVNTPSIVRLDQGRIGITWSEYNSETVKRYIKYKERTSSGAWSAVKAWASSISSSSYFYTPTVTAMHDDVSRNVQIVWRSGTDHLKYVKRVNSVWYTASNLVQGVDPMASVGWNYGGKDILLFHGQTSPYSIGQEILTPIPLGYSRGIGRGESQEVAEVGRGGRVLFENGMISLSILSARLNGVQIGFEPIDDTLRITTPQQFESGLRTVELTERGIITLQLLYSASGEIPGAGTFRAAVRDSRTRQNLMFPASFTGARDTILSLSFPMNLANRFYQLSLQPTILGTPIGYEIEQWYLTEEDSTNGIGMSLGEKTSVIGSQTLPAVFALHNNYPNPFNPTTTLQFDLPEASNVSLIVYDILGREIATLASGSYDAGFHKVEWSPVKESSGIFFVGIRVSTTAGEIKLAKVAKMLFLK